MSPYFESIRIQHQQIHLLPYHNLRLNKTRNALYGCSEAIDLSQHILLPKNIDNSIWKCRVTYAENINQVTFEKYVHRQIQSFKVIEVGARLEYHHKGDRTELLHYYNQKDDCDDIIISKSGFLTDSFWSNIVLSQGGRWYTPSTPLLEGTMRAYLLEQGMITERIIRTTDIHNYDYIMPINALNPFELSRAISTKLIKK